MLMVRWRLLAAVLGVAGLLQGCGGGGGGGWDDYRPRPATVQDVANQAFVFRDFEFGAVFDSSLSSTTTTLTFQNPQQDGTRYRLPFSLSARSATSSGTATLEGESLKLAFSQVDPSLPFTTTRTLSFGITADVDDGRIQLWNVETGVSQTSAPR